LVSDRFRKLESLPPSVPCPCFCAV
jgi:hypothetical protein